jgi:hypothetical protein
LCRSRLEAIPPSLGASRGMARLTWLEIKDRAKVSAAILSRWGARPGEHARLVEPKRGFSPNPYPPNKKPHPGAFCLAVERQPAPNRIRNTRNCPQWLVTSPMRCHRPVFQLLPTTRVSINFCGKMRKDWVEPQSTSVQRIKRIAPWSFHHRRQDRLAAEPSMHSVVQSRQ